MMPLVPSDTVDAMRPEPERIGLLGFEVTYLHSEPGARVSLLEWHAKPRAGGIPIHFHEHTEEAFYVLRGQLALWLDDEEVIREAGSYTVVPPGHQHTFWNPAEEAAVYLTPIAPGGFEDYLRELALGLQGAASDEQAASLRKRLSERHDIRVVGPPPRG
jgi:mannose-6-phosphate isomerase-like protein (cupin superfamily)